MIPLASVVSKTLSKRIKKVTIEAQEKSGFLTTYLVELFKNHKLIKIFQKENYEKNRANERLSQLKEKNKKNTYSIYKNVTNHGNFDRIYDCNINFLLK